MGIVWDLSGERSGHRNGSVCDIINHRELPSAWISGISVSQTLKGWERPIGRGKWLSEIERPERVIGRKADIGVEFEIKNESWR